MLIQKTATWINKSYGLLAPDKELDHIQCLLFIIYFRKWLSESTHSLPVESAGARQ